MEEVLIGCSMEYAQEDVNKMQIKSFQTLNSGQMVTHQILSLSHKIIHMVMPVAVLQSKNVLM
jgi:hypothetical protein